MDWVIFIMTSIKLFKYREINKYFVNSLVNGSIYFAQPGELNDPFDCKVDIENSISNAAKSLDKSYAQQLTDLLEDEDFFIFLQRDINSLGICAFSVWNVGRP